MTQLYRVLYCSRTTTEVSVDEIERILAVSRTNNTRTGVTGGLIFSDQCFAQVLEGPMDAVQDTFERIQCDERHGEITVLAAGPTEKRDFPDWSMAFAGSTGRAFSQTVLDAAFSGQTAAGDDVLALLRNVVVREEAWLTHAAA